MHLAYTPEQERLRQQLREYFAGLMTPELRRGLADTGGDYGDGQAYRAIVRQLGRDGWLALGWPAEYGGRDGSTLDQLIFTDEAATAGVPVPFLTINTVGPTIMRLGTAEQKERYLPRIAAGEIHFSIGYSEPEAGTDLAALRTRAVRDGDSYVINGQKMWTSLIQYADYVWLACRTDPEAPRHRGLSILIVPTDAPGFSWTPVHTMAGPTTSATYYSDVRVPVSALVGDENQGWPLITNQLNHERVALTSSAPVRSALRQVCDWAAATKLASGQRVIDQEWVQLNLARVHAKAEFLKLVNWRIAAEADGGGGAGDSAAGPGNSGGGAENSGGGGGGVQGSAGGTRDSATLGQGSSGGSGGAQGRLGLGPAAASATKVFGTELATEAYRLLMEVLGANAHVREGSPGAILSGRIERMHRAALILTFGGGTNEVQRDIVAAAGLGLPIRR
jgi:3-oxocholest-4-en-26-oyl-CoA dehydrogenase alpha subunit